MTQTEKSERCSNSMLIYKPMYLADAAVGARTRGAVQYVQHPCRTRRAGAIALTADSLPSPPSIRNYNLGPLLLDAASWEVVLKHLTPKDNKMASTRTTGKCRVGTWLHRQGSDCVDAHRDYARCSTLTINHSSLMYKEN